MKKQVGFLGSFENYTWIVLERASPSLPYFAAGLVFLMIGSSIVRSKASLAGVRDLREASIRAAGVGDYTKAQDLFNLHKSQIINSQNVLGVENEEDLVFPYRVIEREIAKYEEMLERYPGHRDIYLVLSKLHNQIGESEQATAYLELARELDPNNEMVILF
ncbi:hypothetical protein KBD69_00685 [Candidatus Woesebacteria bacterium]|nr:hypothetical protein [Candidatus Woesebacteria bacterium]